eukprot:RCo044015
MLGALHAAARAGNKNEIFALIVDGAGVNAHDDEGWTPLHHAAAAGHLEVVRQLVNNDASLLSAVPETGATPLHIATQRGHLACVELLLRLGCGPGTTDDRGATALHIAAEGGHLKVVRLLLDLQASVTSRDAAGNTPLHWAVRAGQTSVVLALLRASSEDGTGPSPRVGAGALAQFPNHEGFPALHFAVQHDQPTLLPLLARTCGSVNSV